jgi:hypothetical protein
MNEWREQERTLESQLSGLSVRLTADTALTAAKVFELRYGLGKSLAHIQKAVLARRLSSYDLIETLADVMQVNGIP